MRPARKFSTPGAMTMWFRSMFLLMSSEMRSMTALHPSILSRADGPSAIRGLDRSRLDSGWFR